MILAGARPRLADWAYVRDGRGHGSEASPAAFYRYSPDRKGERPRDHLSGYGGFLQGEEDRGRRPRKPTNGYAGYDRLYGDRIKEVACMAHVRGKFFDSPGE